jgi:hypothetical protein
MILTKKNITCAGLAVSTTALVGERFVDLPIVLTNNIRRFQVPIFVSADCIGPFFNFKFSSFID